MPVDQSAPSCRNTKIPKSNGLSFPALMCSRMPLRIAVKFSIRGSLRSAGYDVYSLFVGNLDHVSGYLLHGGHKPLSLHIHHVHRSLPGWRDWLGRLDYLV